LDAGNREIFGVIGLERAGATALVRSLTVGYRCRSQGFGRQLLDYLEQEARALGVRQLVLLTTWGQRYFGRAGFRLIERHQVPEALQGSAQFGELCPPSAVCMMKSLESANG
jgi:amino-acid N-acetyltransferase